ncbi:MAG TPA: CBS domain-containing protein [Candidatus Nanopusillus sp.]|nr:CBS domain-containing protein [Candidatus Nanopusillus sp.]HIP90620.1 CBS domain-containing protein [Candidatus Nanopusillus sp.]
MESDDRIVFAKKDTKIREILGAIKENKHIIVLDEEGKYYGILPRDVLVKVAFNLDAKIGNYVIRVRPLSESDTSDILKVIEKMVAANVRVLPIESASGEIAIIDIYDVLEKIKDSEFLNEKVEKYMHEEVVTIYEREPVTKAIAIMKRKGVSRLVVLDESDRPVGMVTAGDIVRNILFEKERPKVGEIAEIRFSVEVRSIMSTPLLTVKPKSKLKDVVRLLLENKIFAIPVVNSKLKGMISAKEILAGYIAYHKKMEFNLVIHGIPLDEYDIEWIKKRVEKLVQRFTDLIGERPTLIMHIKKIRSRYFVVRARLIGSKISLYASSEGYGLYSVISNVLRVLREDLVKIKYEREKKYLLTRLLKEGL